MDFNVKIITTALTILGGTIAAWNTLDPWPKVGWVTPAQYETERDETMGEIKNFRDEWKCDEWDEELRDLLREQAAGNHSPDLAEDIRRLREKMTDLNCNRFDD